MTAQAMTSAGVVENITLRENTESGGVRVAFDLQPDGQESADLRVDLLRDGQPAGEVWVFRWTS
jgi:glucans biosynthesis protein